MQETEAYITIKDHKENFSKKVPCKISRAILDEINNHIQKEMDC